MRMPGQGRLIKKLSSTMAGLNKKAFVKFIQSKSFHTVLRNKLSSQEKIDIELVTYAGSSGFHDFLLSVLSFISNVGIPTKWTLYADNEFSPNDKAILQSIPFLSIQDWYVHLQASNTILDRDKWQCRKFLSFSNHPVLRTTILLDSDIVFYPFFLKCYHHLHKHNWYLPEPVDAYSVDAAFIEDEHFLSDMYIINSGFIVLNDTPNWEIGKLYLERRCKNNAVTHFSEQTAINLIYRHDLAARILEPRLFHLSTIDHFTFKSIDTTNLAMRHFVGPIRHKMWQAGWKQLL
jgi:hypothetical protein